VSQQFVRVDPGGSATVARGPGQHERHAVSGVDGERGDRFSLGTLQLHRRTHPHGVGSGDRFQAAASGPDPRHHAAVVESQQQFGVHLDRAGDALHDPYDVDRGRTRRHEVDHLDATGRRVPFGLQHQRVAVIAAVG
jgi:hypothetical protein